MNPRKIAVLVETSTSWGEHIIRGVSNYVREHTRWMLTVDHRGPYETMRLPYNWKGDGVIARVNSQLLADQLAATGLPSVNVSQIRVAGSSVPQVTANEDSIGRLAARHLLDRGIESFGYYGPPYREHYTDSVRPAFQQELGTERFEVKVFDPDRYVRSSDTMHDDLPRLTRWLEGINRPAGILAWNTAGARRISDACHYLGQRVPEEVAIISGDHDELMASIADPQVTCIDHNPLQVGYQAAATLDRMMRGERVPAVQLIEPSGVIARQSTDTLAVEDPELARAVRFIRENAHRPIQVSDVLELLPISRRALELRFRKALGCSPASVIRQARIERARRLLIETRLSVSQVAAGSGFQHQEVMQRAFRRRFQMSPSQYRRRFLSGNMATPIKVTASVGGIRLV